MSNIVESVEGAIKKAEAGVVTETKDLVADAVAEFHKGVAEAEKIAERGCKFTCAECDRLAAAAKAEAEKVAAEAEAEARKLKMGADEAIKNVEVAMTAFVKALKDSAAKSTAIKELETVVDHLKHPAEVVVDSAAALAARATQDAAVAAAKELEAQAKEDASAASGWIARTWHKVWAWL